MKTISQVLIAILNDIQDTMPELLEKHHAGNFQRYVIGYPLDREEQNQLCLRFSGRTLNDNDTFMFDIQAFLPGILEIEAYKYIDAVSEYLNNFDPARFGYVNGSYEISLTDDLRVKTLSVFWSVALTYFVDDCDR